MFKLRPVLLRSNPTGDLTIVERLATLKEGGQTILNHATKNISYDWVSGELPTGVYTVSIILNNSIAKLQNGNSYTFQIQSGNPYVIYIYIGIIAFFAIIIAVLFIASYYARKRRPKWNK